MTPKLKILKDWNSERMAYYSDLSIYPHKNGFACPECGEELEDQHEIILSDPPQRLLFCRHCEFRGMRFI